MSTFKKFSIILNSNQFDIIAGTETWLLDTDHQRDYLQVNGLTLHSKIELEKEAAV